ncbi:MAG: hypothetical protein ACHBN1_22510 [Heteroscytonema crispum UTEX LB 1556]
MFCGDYERCNAIALFWVLVGECDRILCGLMRSAIALQKQEPRLLREVGVLKK